VTPASLAAEPDSPPASSAARPAILSRIASFPAAIAALLIMLAVITVRDRFDDPDMWWHLKIGQIIAATHHVPTTDLFSYTTNHSVSLPHEWLAELFIYAAYAAHGYSGLMFWECGLTAAILVAGFLLCSLYCGNAKLGLLGALVIWVFGTIGFSVRPHMVGYLLLIAELIILHLGRTRSPRWFFTLPPLFVLWVNCHGSFPLGAVILAVSALVSTPAVSIPGFDPPIFNRSGRRLLLAAIALCIPALFISPVGFEQVLYPFQVMWHSPMNLGEVNEWRHLQFDDGRTYFFIAVLGSIATAALLRRVRLRADELLILGLAAIEAARHQRLLFPFGIIAAPVFCRVLADLWDDTAAPERHPLVDSGLIVASLAIAWAAFPSSANLTRQVEAFSPVKAVAFLQNHHLRGPIINEYGFGGYLIWAAPEYPVFVDGRGDIFEWTGVLRAFGDWATLKTSSTQLLDDYGVNLCLVGKDSPAATGMRRVHGWREVYSDDNAVVFERLAASQQNGVPE
jgi:hypothetical protein